MQAEFTMPSPLYDVAPYLSEFSGSSGTPTYDFERLKVI